jgi:polysaccharide pyruvyl transferase WcaK-like protein
MRADSPASPGRRAAPAAPGLRVGIFGLLGQGNLGNDGSMESVLAYLRANHPDVILDCFCTEPDVVSQRYGLPAVRLRWYKVPYGPASGLAGRVRRAIGHGLGMVADPFRISSWVRRHDAVIVPGMGVLETTIPMRPWKTPYWMFLLCASGRLGGTNVALVSVGANVTSHRISRWLITSAVRLANYRSYRDDVSRDAMKQMGVDTSGHAVYPDVAFALPVPAAHQREPGSVGIGIMDYSGGNDDIWQAANLRRNYIEQVKRFSLWLLDNGRPVRLFTSDTLDEHIAQDIAADLRTERPGLGPARVVTEPASSISELMRQIALVDTVVATRYHNVLYALLQAKPTLALGYAQKHESLMFEAGLPSFVLSCRSLDADDMMERFSELERRSAQLTEVIAERNRAKTVLVERQFADMSAALFSSSDALAGAPRLKAARKGAQ